MATSRGAAVLDPPLPGNLRLARLGVAYVELLCAEAGYGFVETGSDQDVLAIDAEVQFRRANVRLQIKCSGQFTLSGRSATWPVRPRWREHWAESGVPVYFILVKVDQESEAWFRHDDDGTGLPMAAFWTRVDGRSGSGDVTVRGTQRLTAETLDSWSAEVSALYAPLRQRDEV